eukprot:TRINITY_DN5563_c0_g1_i1.p1 TRINITY_DN5563_c0_g1~~TRINITY_DN5563_c0_g1_i1.p1  ORF type:complete len:211 (-),score=22.01 TRINITY_DN5563_c0_g1_i1:144-776(-)
MGGVFQKVWNPLFAKREVRIITVGLNSSGKTTMLYKLKLGEIHSVIPTIGFNVETISYKNINFTVWDLGGRDKIRALHRMYFQNTQGIIFCVDSNDASDWLDMAKDELWKTIRDDQLVGVPLLVFANKQDLPNSLKVSEIKEKLGLDDIRDRPWYIQASSFPTGDGIYEGLDWLSNAVTNKVAATISTTKTEAGASESGFFSWLFNTAKA